MSLHTLNNGQQAVASANTESTAILREIQAATVNKDDTPPSPNASELKSLLDDVRTALNNNGRDKARDTPSNSRYRMSPGRIAKRRFESIQNDEHPDQPKRQKSHVIGTGPPNDDLLTVTTVAKTSDDLLGYKSMVASRFAPQTDAAKIVSHVKGTLLLPPESKVVMVRSLAPRNRPLSDLTFISFKVTVPEEHFDKLMEPGFWPANTTIREFEPRDSPKIANF